MNNIYKKLFRGAVLVGAMFMADGAVTLLCPGVKGITKGVVCLASVTIFGAAADAGSKRAIDVLESASDKLKGC